LLDCLDKLNCSIDQIIKSAFLSCIASCLKNAYSIKQIDGIKFQKIIDFLKIDINDSNIVYSVLKILRQLMF
jgi:hypothetical protein